MKLAIGSDHGGFPLKEQLRDILRGKGHEVADLGTYNSESTDYPDYAAAVARAVANGEAERGILVCTTGVGMTIAANKINGIRAAMGFNPDEARLARAHNNANVLTFGGKYIEAPAAAELVDIFLTTEFDGGRHARRVAKITALECDCVKQQEP